MPFTWRWPSRDSGEAMAIFGGGATVVRRTTVCLASSIDTHQLRSHLQHLHSEASNTRAKANKARLRLMRLSEAAEKLQWQAFINVRSGKENEARELLFQKKKAMEALEKTKSRIELLDELSRKLIEAISLHESRLVGTVGLDVETESVGKDAAATPVRIVSPPIGNGNGNGVMGSLEGVTSYEGLLDDVDRRLGSVEAELAAAVRSSSLVFKGGGGGGERPERRKVQQVMEILDAVGHLRERIALIMQTKEEMQ